MIAMKTNENTLFIRDIHVFAECENEPYLAIFDHLLIPLDLESCGADALFNALAMHYWHC